MELENIKAAVKGLEKLHSTPDAEKAKKMATQLWKYMSKHWAKDTLAAEEL